MQQVFLITTIRSLSVFLSLFSEFYMLVNRINKITILPYRYYYYHYGDIKLVYNLHVICIFSG